MYSGLLSAFAQTIFQSGVLSIAKTDCKITCSESDGCYDDGGTFQHTSACAWTE